MRDPPEAAQLLALADASPAAEWHLVRRARDIAVREQGFGMTAYDAVAAELRLLYGPLDGARLLRRLAADLRAGRFDAPDPVRARLRHLLLALAAQKLRESNPDFLTGTGFA
ncbi:MAG TPA: hypothetical protein VMU87_01580 [Stellaceae bacterium]|nr:hypothetical protein [Stellaceae bacterium]